MTSPSQTLEQVPNPEDKWVLLGARILQGTHAERREIVQELHGGSEEAFFLAIKSVMQRILQLQGGNCSLGEFEQYLPGVDPQLLRRLWSEDQTTGQFESAATTPYEVGVQSGRQATELAAETGLAGNDTSQIEGAGDKAGRFHITTEHASGGLGVVYRADDRQLDRLVALKQIRREYADKPAYREKFLREAMLTGKLEHPSIVPVYALGTDTQGRPFYAMRFIKGQTLKDRITAYHQGLADQAYAYDSMALRKLLRRFLDVCQAIDYAHSRGVIHRDLKPSNIMLGKYGETLVVDWGLARQFESKLPEERTVVDGLSRQSELQIKQSDTPSDALTQMGSFVGSIPYASPEQLRGDLDALGPATDIYSLGAVLFEILTGKPPVGEFGSLKSLADEILLGKIPGPRSVIAAVPRPLDAICRRAMAGIVSERYSSADDLRMEIEAFLDDETVQAYNETLTDRVKRYLRKRPAVFSGAAATILAGLGFLAVFAWNKSIDNAVLMRANAEKDKAVEVASLQEREANTQRQLARDTIVRLVREVNEGQEKGSDIAAVRQNLFAILLSQFEVLTSGTATDAGSRLEILSAKVGLAKSVASLGRVSVPNAFSNAGPLRATSEDELNRELARELKGDDTNRTYLSATHTESPTISSQPQADVGIILHLVNKDITKELNRSSELTEEQFVRLLQLALDGVRAMRDSESLQHAVSLCEEINQRCEFYTADLPAGSTAVAEKIELVRLHTLRLSGLMLAERMETKEGVSLLRQVMNRSGQESRVDPAGFRLLHAMVLCDLGVLGPNDQSFMDWYGMLDKANRLAKEIRNPELEDETKQLRYTTLFRMSIMKGTSHPEEAEQLMNEAREIYPGESFERQWWARAGLQQRREHAWSKVSQADNYLDNEGKLEAAAQLYQEAFTILQELFDRNQNSRESRRDLATAYERLGVIALRRIEDQEQPDTTEAKQHFERMLELKRELASDITDWLAQIELGITYGHFADLAKLREDHSEAIRWSEDRIVLLENAFKEFPDEPQVHRSLLLAHWDLAACLEGAEQYSRAEMELKKAYELALRLDLGPSRLPYVRNLQTRIEKNLLYVEALSKALIPLEDLLNFAGDTTTEQAFLAFALWERLRWLAEEEQAEELAKTIEAIDQSPNKYNVGYDRLIASYLRLAKTFDTEADSPKRRSLMRRAEELASEAIRKCKLTYADFRTRDSLRIFRESSLWEVFHRPNPQLREYALAVLPYCRELYLMSGQGEHMLRPGDDVPAEIYAIRQITIDDGKPRLPQELLSNLPEVIGLYQLMIERNLWLTNSDLQFFSGCEGLGVIGLGGNTQISASGLQYLAEIETLDTLYLGSTRVNLAMAEAIARLPNVRLLDVNNCGIDDRSLPFFAKMKSLDNLCLSNNAISDEGVKALLPLKLSVLRLSETDISDTAVEILSPMDSLQILSLTENNLTDRIIPHLRRLINLGHLQIDRNPISAAALASLSSLTGLYQLDVNGCNVTPEDIMELQQRLPFCTVSDQETYRERENKGRSAIAEGQ